MTIWHLKKGSEKKFRFGHPWVFSNELAQSPKGIRPGELIELRDFSGAFLARGYGHPNSLISFRTLSTRQEPAIDGSFFIERFKIAARAREIAGLDKESHRLCFAEGDRLPGLVIDRFILAGELGQAFVVQSSTAGMDALLEQVIEGLEGLVKHEAQKHQTSVSWQNTVIIIANDSKARTMEGLVAEPKKVIQSPSGFNAEKAKLLVQAASSEHQALTFTADLVGGQKTGFFLDQRSNVQITARFVKQLLANESLANKREIRVLDLCCYIGQWGTQLANLATQHGKSAHVTLVDASSQALQIAAENVQAHGGVAEIRKLDVLGQGEGGLDALERRSYDVVICDPPAFIKKKKDLPTGAQAYYKMNREAIRKTAPSGIYVSCSCSGLFGEEDFRSMLARVMQSFDGDIRWLARGGHSPDHTQRPEFPQGTYLKSWIGAVL